MSLGKRAVAGWICSSRIELEMTQLWEDMADMLGQRLKTFRQKLRDAKKNVDELNKDLYAQI